MGEYVVPPPGYHFKPTDEELITFYLQTKVSRQPLPANCIMEKKIYGKESNPWDVFRDDDPWEISTSSDKMGTKTLKKTVYAFTTLSKSGKKRISRIAGCGIWDGQTGATMIKNSQGNIIGSKKMFTFETKGDLLDDVKKIHGHWIMHEYSLDGVLLVNGLKFNEVICKITRTWKGKDLAVVESKKRSRTMEDGGPNSAGDGEKFKKARMMVPISTDMQESSTQEVVPLSTNLSDNNEALGQEIKFDQFYPRSDCDWAEVFNQPQQPCASQQSEGFEPQQMNLDEIFFDLHRHEIMAAMSDSSLESHILDVQESSTQVEGRVMKLDDINFDRQETLVLNDLDVISSLQWSHNKPCDTSSNCDCVEGLDEIQQPFGLHQSEGFTTDGFVHNDAWIKGSVDLKSIRY